MPSLNRLEYEFNRTSSIPTMKYSTVPINRLDMKRFFKFSPILAVAAFLAACNPGGSSAPPPTNVNALAGDSSVTVTWDAAPGVEYWLFIAPGNSLTSQGCFSTTGCQIIKAATSPVVVSSPINGGTAGYTSNGNLIALTNGTTYSFTLNGRTGGGPGGADSPSVSATPRLAGSNWTSGAAITANDMHGVTSGTVTLAGVSSNVLVAVGAGGSIFSSADGKNWTTPASGVPVTSTLNAATSAGTTYIAAGAGGVILKSTDTASWTPQTSGTAENLNALASNGGGGYVAVGDNGTILHSSDSGTTWTPPVAGSGTTSHLYAVTYAATAYGGMYVAVGAAGALLTSIDQGGTWVPAAWSATPASSILKSVAYGGLSTTYSGPPGTTPVINGVNTFVVVGAAGTLVTGVYDVSALTWTWTLQAPMAANPNLNSVTYGHQFIAVGENGVIYTSLDGASWQLTTSSATIRLNAITHRKFDYSIVGEAGLNLFSM